MAEKEPYLMKLPAYKFYYIMNKKNGSEYSRLCTSLTESESIQEKFFTFCNMLATSIKFIQEHKDEISFVQNPCRLLNYLMYDKIFTAFSVDTNNLSTNENSTKFYKIWTNLIYSSEFKGKDICVPELYSIGTDLWKKWKSYTEYYENFNELEQKKYINKQECNIYKNYVESNAKLYEMFHGFFDNGETWNCPDFFLKEVKYKAEDLISSLNCDILPSSESLTLKLNQPSVSDKHGKGLTPAHSDEVKADRTLNPKEDTFGMGTYHIFMLISFLFIGLLIISVILYKANANSTKKSLTSFGTWFRWHILKKRSILRDINEEEEALFENTPESNNSGFHNKLLHIAYPPE
ncbi:PIR protein [Plasmodium ovale]|uniref:PIR protein n=1 Tax=Plasmodium ovale TaxID=36330 RepID=A0A1D3JDG2_PLAOA|nr:PIR protein [Plasmodium ovale]